MKPKKDVLDKGGTRRTDYSKLVMIATISVAALFILSSINLPMSAATNLIGCREYVHFNFNPSNGGYITWNGQTQFNGEEQLLLCNTKWPISGNANSGWAFAYWTVSGNGGLSATDTNPTTLDVGSGPNGASMYVNAYFAQLPQMLHTYNFTSSNSGSSGIAPSSLVNITSPQTSSSTSTYELNGVWGKDPYTIWVSTGYINSQKHVWLTWRDNSSLCCDGSPFNYPNGNTSVSVDLVPDANNQLYANVTGMSVDFKPALGSAVNVGDVFAQSYGSYLYSSVIDLSGQVSQEAMLNYLGSSNQTLVIYGKALKDASFALADFGAYLQNSTTCQSCLTSGIAGVLVPHIASWTVTANLTPECGLSLALFGVSVISATLMAEPETGVLAYQAIHVAGIVYDVYDLSHSCLSVSYG